jgi:OmpA-OmpF porin, OOP family
MYHVIGYKIYHRVSIIRAIVIILISLFYISSGSAQTQDSISISKKEFRRKARQSEKKGKIYDAIYYYSTYLESGEKDTKSAYCLAGLYFVTRDYENARRFYDTVVTEKAKKYPVAYYQKGLVCMNLQDYTEAMESFSTFRKLFRGKKDPDQLRRLASDHIESCTWAMDHIDSIQNVTITNLGTAINKPHIEFSPFPIGKDRLIYGGLIEDSIRNRGNHRKLYEAEKIDKIWETVGELEGPFNSGDYHTGNAVISANGERIYFTRCRKNWKNRMICEIYLSEKIDDQWQEPQKLPYPINDENYTTTQPALGVYLRTGADILYFVSDREGTRGGLDIWYAVFDIRTGEFKEPRNAGRAINSRGDECCPFYDNSNRTMYFSSKGLNGFGGYDIYKTTGSSRTWTETVPLPQPVNTSYDDMYFSTIDGGQEGFFTSNRPGSYAMVNGSCCDDIFHYRFNECTKVYTEGHVINVTNYDIYDELNEKYDLGLEYPETNVPAGGVPVQLYLINRAGEELLISQLETDEQGNYNFQLDVNRDYKVVVKNYGFFDKVVTLNTHDIECSDTLDVGISKINVLPKITVRINVYYEHDKSRLTREARATIDTLLLPVFDLFPNAIIEIGSHTDNTGSDSYNDKLSQRRSESVVNYLISKGILTDRLVARGYGESQPIAPNTHPDGTDNPEGRQLNRRTELRIVGELSTFYLDE